MAAVNKHLIVLFCSLFVISIGFGITLPILPFYAERLAMASGSSHKTMAWHVGLLTSIFPLMQLLFAPFWGRLSDRIGRRPLLLAGIAGYGAAQLLFGLAASLPLLYTARILGGILASATMPAATAYVADATDEHARARGMAWLGTAVSLGAVAGPALGGMVAWHDWHIHSEFGHFVIDGFSLPFFAAALMTFITLAAAITWLPESRIAASIAAVKAPAEVHWRDIGRKVSLPLGLSSISQLGIALFETAFVLYAQARLGFGPAQIAIGFMICGSVMSVFQAVAVGYLSGCVTEMIQVSAGFLIMGTGIFLLSVLREPLLVYGAIGMQAFGMALISPNLSSIISKVSGTDTGTALGLNSSAGNLGQFLGPMLGAVLFTWHAVSPYLFASMLLLIVGTAIGASLLTTKSRAIPAAAL
jgi:DHA1 family multidrug resistance protein-like MFS transporter